jgi:hypothetical protein
MMWLLTLLIVVIAAEVDAATRYVDPACGALITTYNPTAAAGSRCTGGSATSLSTISAGVGTTGAGDVLYIRAGTYSGSLNVSNKNGAPGSHVTIAGYPGETVTLFPATNANAVIGLSGASHGTYITLQHLVFNGVNQTCTTSSMPLQKGIDIKDGTHHVTVDDVEILNICGIVFYVDVAEANSVILRNSSFHDIRGVDQDGFRSIGWYIFSSNGITLENNLLYNIAGGGGQIYPGPNTNCLIRGNTFHHNSTLETTRIGGLTISGPGTNCKVYNNLSYENGLTPVAGFERSGFTITASSESGSSIGYQLFNNTTVGNRFAGINIFPGVGSTNLIRNNIAFGNLSTQINNLGTPTFSNNVTSDPLFVNRAADNFHLQGSGPAVNTGLNLTACGVSTDFDGIDRPTGGGTCASPITGTAWWEVGAYEFGTDTTPPDPPTGVSIN